jgi:hypothetical protein
MKIEIVSNFVIPGLEDQDGISMDKPIVTLREVLEELSLRNSGRVKYIKPSTGAVDPMNFLIEVNGLPIQDTRESLEVMLKEGDIVKIQLAPLGGG